MKKQKKKLTSAVVALCLVGSGCVVTKESDPPVDVDPPAVLSVIMDVTPPEDRWQVCEDMGGHLIREVCIDVDY